MGQHIVGVGTRPEAKKVIKERIEREIFLRAGYDLKTFRKRIKSNAFDAIRVLNDVKDMASGKFFYDELGIHPYDFKRNPK